MQTRRSPTTPPDTVQPTSEIQTPNLPRSILRPKILTAFRGYDRHALWNDVLAGLIVGIVALPLAIAFAIASGVSPEKGLITAVVGGFLISALSGSRVQIGGPTGAFVVIVFGIVQKYGLDGLMVSTMMAGAFMIGMGFAGLGSLIRFIPYPLTVGFTSGIAALIASSQVRDFFGLHMEKVPADFFPKWSAYFHAASTINPWAAGMSLVSVAIIALWPRVTSKLPGSLIALLLATAATQLFHLPVETIASRVGALPSSLPMPALPHLDWSAMQGLVRPAMTIALLASIESLLCATVADGMIGGRHRPNMELIAQGVANLASPLFGGIPATGAIARTATNVKNGGRTPIAGIVHALVLLFIMLACGRWAGLIPLPVLAAILAVVAYNMSEWRTFRELLRSPRSDVAILLTTFVLTVVVDLTVALEAGMLVSLLAFLRQMSESVRIEARASAPGDSEDWSAVPLPKGVEVFDVHGPLFFGAAQRFEESIKETGRKPSAIIVRLRDAGHIDATGLHAIRQLAAHCRHHRMRLLLAGLQPQPRQALEDAGMLASIGADNLVPSVAEAARVLAAA